MKGFTFIGVLLLLLPFISWSQSADKSGVKTNTISLPSGPGSIEGLGESFQPSLNTGQASYGVSFALPAGTAGHAPNLALRYNGGSGNSPMGYGWSMSLPYVQRQCDKGTPLYVDAVNGVDDDFDGIIDEADELDVFINETKEELVQTEDGFYFCENENAFIRYQRKGEHWIAHLPNGILLEFGLTMDSRVYDDETGNVHSWLLDRMTDTNGNTVVYTYKSFDCKKDRNQKYLHKIEYGAGAPPWDAFHFVRLAYEDRFDWFEDCRAGFKIRTGQRLRHVYTGTQGVSFTGHQTGDFNEDGTSDYLNRKYQLDYDTHQHWSLLSKVTWIGGDGVTPYPPISFQYTNISPADTIVVLDKMIGEQNTPMPHHINDPSTDLVDLNADGLPDLLKTESGRHTVYLNKGEQEGANRNTIVWNRGEEVQFEDNRAGRVYLQEGQSGISHLADMDADGLADLVCKPAFGEVYYFSNKGNKTWGIQRRMTIASGESAPPSPFGQANVKTADIDFDKHVDIIQSIPVAGTHYYRIWFNLGNQQYSQAVTVTQENGFDFSLKSVHIADFNGDRVPDILWIRPTGIVVTAGLGHGEFDEPMFVPMPDYLLSNEEIQGTSLQDLNGDGLVDLIIERPAPNQMWYWLNQGNYSLDKRRFIFGTPSRRGNPATRWADMNGNGTTDFVHIDEYDGMQVLDIGRLIGAVPAPNMLLQVDNGIGQKTKLDYTTSTKYLLDDRENGKEWKYPLPFPVNVVSKATISDGMGNDYETEFSYHDGYYDGKEKEFRGFGMVESRELGDASAPDLIIAYEFDTGAVEEALKGKQLSSEARNAQGEVFYRQYQTWTTRTLHESETGDERKVTFPYQVDKVQDVIEKGNGMPVQLKWEFEFDDYGNLTKQIEHGRIDEGWDDERIGHTTYTSAFPDGITNWIIAGVVEQRTTDKQDTLVAHSRTYYDGYTELGRIEKGNTTRVENWVDSTKYIVSIRNDYDEYGNIIAAYDPLYGTQAGHYRELRYDPYFHAFPEEEIIHTGKTEPATLNFKATYDYGYGTVLNSTEFNGHTTTYDYDAFARLTAITKPLDTIPTTEYSYILAQPHTNGRIINWVESRALDNSNGDNYLHSRTFVDGLGREIMTRAEGEYPGQVVVTNTAQFNKRKQARKNYLPYFERGSLDFTDPTFNTGFTEHFYDALGRPIRINQPVGPKGIAFSQTQYEPLSLFSQDEEQTNPNSKHFGCGNRSVMDGLNDSDGNPRMRQNYQFIKLSDEGEAIDSIVQWQTVYDYDLLNNLTRFTDAQYNQKLFGYDALSRKIFNNDPNRGISHYTYDDASNLRTTRDAKQQTIRYDYDGLNRLIAEYYAANSDSADVRYHYDTPYGTIEKGAYWEADSLKVEANNTLGYLSWIADQTGEEHNAYDERGRVKWTVKRIGLDKNRLENYFTAFTYDPMDRVKNVAYPDASTVAYTYNSRGLLEAVPNIIERYDYNPAGQNALLQLTCGTQTTYQYDHRLRLSKLKSLRLRDSLAVQDLRYSFDEVSNITHITDARDTITLDSIGAELELPSLTARKYDASQSFIYDNLYRLTRAANNKIYGTIDYRYDRTGNMLRKNADLLEPNPLMDLGTMINGGDAGAWNRIGRTANDVVGPNAITSTRGGMMTFRYDANGNMTKDEKANYHWDVKDRLRKVVKDSLQANYHYDYMDSRKLKVVDDTIRVIYIDKVAEVRGGQLIKYYYAGMSRIAQVKTDTSYFLNDHLGSTSLSLNDTAKVVEQMVKHPYGLTRLAKNTGFSADYTFTGKEQDFESDNFYFEARYYNAVVGRFLSVDPLLNDLTQIGKSPYGYVSGNPMKYNDPTGEVGNLVVQGLISAALDVFVQVGLSMLAGNDFKQALNEVDLASVAGAFVSGMVGAGIFKNAQKASVIAKQFKGIKHAKKGIESSRVLIKHATSSGAGSIVEQLLKKNFSIRELGRDILVGTGLGVFGDMLSDKIGKIGKEFLSKKNLSGIRKLERDAIRLMNPNMSGNRVRNLAKDYAGRVMGLRSWGVGHARSFIKGVKKFINKNVEKSIDNLNDD